MKYDKLDDRLRSAVEYELLADETLKWVGQPNPLRRARTKLVLLGFGVVWLLFILFMFNQFNDFGSGFSSRSSGFSSIFSLMLTIFLFVGLAMLLSPVWEYLKATRTYYAVTNRRALIIEKWIPGSVRSYSERDIDYIERRGDDRQGDVFFAHETRTRSRNNWNNRGGVNITFGNTSSTYTVNIGFYGIPNPREVEAMMLETFRSDDDEPKRKRY